MYKENKMMSKIVFSFIPFIFVLIISCQNSVNELSKDSSLNCDEPTVSNASRKGDYQILEAIFEVYNHYSEVVYYTICATNSEYVHVVWDRKDFDGTTVESGTYVAKVSIRTKDEHFCQCQEFYVNKYSDDVFLLYDLNKSVLMCSTGR